MGEPCDLFLIRRIQLALANYPPSVEDFEGQLARGEIGEGISKFANLQ